MNEKKSQRVESKIHIVSVSIKLFLIIWFFSFLWHIVTFSFVNYVYFKGQKDKKGKEHTYIVSLENLGASPIKNKSEEEKTEAPDTEIKQEEEQEVETQTEQQEVTEEVEAETETTNENTGQESDNNTENTSGKSIAELIGIGQGEKSSSAKSTQDVVKKIISSKSTKTSQVYSLRTSKNRNKSVQKYGGSAESENSVELGLKWLIRHQDYDGKWDPTEFYIHSSKEDCWGVGSKKYISGITALSYLAFLGAGYTSKKGLYKKQLANTEKYLLRLQDADGFFDVKEMYNNSIVLLALCESYSIDRDKNLESAIRLGIAATVQAQQASGGWTYQGITSQERNDTSITGWQVMALVSARRAGFTVPQRVLDRTWNHFQRMITRTGEVRYEDIGVHTMRMSKALVPVALLCSILLNKENPHTYKQIGIMDKSPPQWSMRHSLDNSMYYWYHGTLSLFLVGGASWKRWNSYMRDMLIDNQIKAGNAAGSWDPTSKWSSAGGRLYSTAINILNLEIYYRYHPNFIKD